MSTGPEHYAEAERLLDGVTDFTAEGFRNESRIDRLGALSAAAQTTIALAQVHATLALTAATAQGVFDPQGHPLVESSGNISVGWGQVLSP